MPNLPTIAESGVKGYEAEQWYGVIAPRGTPPAIIGRLAGELRNIIVSSDVRERFLSQGIVPVSSTPEQFALTIRDNVARFAKVIQSLDMKIE
jgi:tripartite-type tricarboxylate transporter receptor subunit TctC